MPIIRPSSGVMPIEVDADEPSQTAVTEHPLPKWATTMPSSDARRPSRRAASRTDQATDNPWNPYRRTPQSRVQAAGTGYVTASTGNVR